MRGGVGAEIRPYRHIMETLIDRGDARREVGMFEAMSTGGGSESTGGGDLGETRRRMGKLAATGGVDLGGYEGADGGDGGTCAAESGLKSYPALPDRCRFKSLDWRGRRRKNDVSASAAAISH